MKIAGPQAQPAIFPKKLLGLQSFVKYSLFIEEELLQKGKPKIFVEIYPKKYPFSRSQQLFIFSSPALESGVTKIPEIVS